MQERSSSKGYLRSPTIPLPLLECDVRLDPDKDLVRVSLRGELDLSTTPAVERAFGDLVRTARGDVLLDARGLRFMDVAGLRSILGAARSVGERTHRLSVSNCAGPVARVIELTGNAWLLDENGDDRTDHGGAPEPQRRT